MIANFQTGSVVIPLHILTDAVAKVENALLSRHGQARSSLLTILEWGAVSGAFNLYKMFKQKKGRPITDEDYLARILSRLDNIERLLFIKIYNDAEVQAALRAALRPLRADGIVEFQTRRREVVVETVRQSDLKSADEAEESAIQEVEEKVLDIEKAALVPHLSWHFSDDLRGNTGGGIGVLRVMSLLTPKQLPVGTFLSGKLVQSSSLDDKPLVFDRIPSQKWGLFPVALKFVGLSLVRKAMGRRTPVMVMTEGSNLQGFQGHVVLLVDRHTASANEMLIAFARENRLATIVGEATPGRVLGGNKFKMPYGYRLALPVGAYQTTAGDGIEGKEIAPDALEPFDPEAAREGSDRQMERAIEVVSRL